MPLPQTKPLPYSSHQLILTGDFFAKHPLYEPLRTNRIPLTKGPFPEQTYHPKTPTPVPPITPLNSQRIVPIGTSKLRLRWQTYRLYKRATSKCKLPTPQFYPSRLTNYPKQTAVYPATPTLTSIPPRPALGLATHTIKIVLESPIAPEPLTISKSHKQSRDPTAGRTFFLGGPTVRELQFPEKHNCLTRRPIALQTRVLN